MSIPLPYQYIPKLLILKHSNLSTQSFVLYIVALRVVTKGTNIVTIATAKGVMMLVISNNIIGSSLAVQMDYWFIVLQLNIPD